MKKRKHQDDTVIPSPPSDIAPLYGAAVTPYHEDNTRQAAYGKIIITPDVGSPYRRAWFMSYDYCLVPGQPREIEMPTPRNQEQIQFMKNAAQSFCKSAQKDQYCINLIYDGSMFTDEEMTAVCHWLRWKIWRAKHFE